MIHKEVLKDIKIGEFQLKKGELCNILVIGNMRSPKYIKDPEEFNPERWREPIMAESNCSFIPFSSGYRNCKFYFIIKKNKKTLLNRYRIAFSKA